MGQLEDQVDDLEVVDMENEARVVCNTKVLVSSRRRRR